MKAGKAVGQDLAGEEVPQLTLHEDGQARSIWVVGDAGEEGLEVHRQHLVEDRPLRPAAAVALGSPLCATRHGEEGPPQLGRVAVGRRRG